MNVFSVKEASKYFEKSERTIYSWLKSNKLNGKKVDGKWQVFINITEEKNTKAAKHYKIERMERLDSLVQKLEKSIKEHAETIEKLKVDLEESKKREIRYKQREAKCFHILNRNQKQIIKQVHTTKKENEKQSKDNSKNLLLLSNRLDEIEKQKAQFSEEAGSADKISCRELVYNNLHNNQSNSKVLKSEEKAERWARNNINLWFTQPCKTGQLAKHSWEEIALNRIGKVNIKGHMQKSRAFLHIVAKTNDSHWKRIKARIALELTQQSQSEGTNNHYFHPHETDGVPD